MEIIKENEIKTPYDLAELLWFILPGATLIVCIFLFEYWLNSNIIYDKNKTKELDSLVTILNEEENNLNVMTKSQKVWVVRALTKLPINDTMVNYATDSFHANYKKKIFKEIQQLSISFMNNKDTSLIINNEIKEFVIGLSQYIQDNKKLIHTPFYSAIKVTKTSENVFKDNWFLSSIYIIVLLSVCYVIGHIIYMIASFAYERMLIMKGYSYPYEKLLRLNERFSIFKKSKSEFRRALKIGKTKQQIKNDILDQTREEVSQGFYRGMFFYLYCNLLIDYIIIITCPQYTTNTLIYLFSNIFILTIILPSIAKSATAEMILKWKLKLINSKWITFFSKTYPKLIDILDNFLNDYLHTQRSFEQNFIDYYGAQFFNTFKIVYSEYPKTNYWLSKFYIIEKSLNLGKQIIYWEKIYRFSKSLSASFAIVYLYCMISILLHEPYLRKIGGYYSYDILILHYIPLVYLILNLITLKYYIYVYDNRYSRLILRSFVALKKV